MSDAEIEEIVRSQFLFVEETIKNGVRHPADFKNVRLINLGIFGVTRAKLKFLKKLNEEKEAEMSLLREQEDSQDSEDAR